jgi:hypothetical protein
MLLYLRVFVLRLLCVESLRVNSWNASKRAINQYSFVIPHYSVRICEFVLCFCRDCLLAFAPLAAAACAPLGEPSHRRQCVHVHGFEQASEV